MPWGDLSDGLAVGVELYVIPTEEGGRVHPIGGDDYPELAYRPNWGLPEMTPPEQTGAPVLCFAHTPVELGDTVRAVIIPMYPDAVPGWSTLRIGDALPMYEGTRVCGRGTVAWVLAADRPLSDSDREHLYEWVAGGEPPRT